MKKVGISFFIFLLGMLATYFLLQSRKGAAEATQSKLISYEIKKLNKMIVLEEVYTYQQAFEGSVLPKSWIEEYAILKNLDHKRVVLLAKGTSQVSYDMKKMNIEVDEPNQKLLIKSLPEPIYQLFTEVNYQNLETGAINKIGAEELNEYKAYVENKIKEQVDRKDLEKKAHQQLIENLSDIFVLAKALNWEIIDETEATSEVESYLQNL